MFLWQTSYPFFQSPCYSKICFTSITTVVWDAFSFPFLMEDTPETHFVKRLHFTYLFPVLFHSHIWNLLAFTPVYNLKVANVPSAFRLIAHSSSVAEMSAGPMTVPTLLASTNSSQVTPFPVWPCPGLCLCLRLQSKHVPGGLFSFLSVLCCL